MELDLPSWLDASFLAAALQGGEDREPPVRVTKFSATPAVAPGENYFSHLHRVKVDYNVGDEEKSTSLILKAPLEKGLVDEMIGDCEFYEKEPKMYNELLPIINGIIGFELGPKSYFSTVKNVVIMSDLRDKGYEVCDRHKQLDFPHCERVFRTLAKFHAASVVCKRVHPDLIDQVGKELMHRESERFDTKIKPWFQQCIKTVAGIVGEMKISKEVEELFSSRIETIADSALRIFNPKRVGFKVINHGDLWGNNVLFKHTSSGDIVDLKIIDYQLVRYTSPVVDLIYFMWTSANEEVRESRLPELCEIYRRTLNSTLESLGSEERLTEDELQRAFKDSIDWAFITICSFLPAIISDRDTVFNLEEETSENITKTDNQFFKLLNGKHYRTLLPTLLKQLLKWVSSM